VLTRRRHPVLAWAGASLAVLLLVALPASARADDAVPPDTSAAPAVPPDSASDPSDPDLSGLPLRRDAVGERVRLVQQRLAWLGHEVSKGDRAALRMGTSTQAAVRAFQVKFGLRPTGIVGAGTWDVLRQLAGPVGRLPRACVAETSICIDKSTRLVRYVVDGRPVLTLDARFGFVGAETREGSFRVASKSRNHVSSLYRSPMPFSLFFHGGQAVHYSPYFARDGYNGASHGCVNLRDYAGARRLFDRADVGTRVHVYRS
jgi:hypothetical protein